jgi:AraC-like DNA-binding protein
MSGTFRILKPLVGLYMRYRIERITAYDASLASSVRLAIPTLIGTGHCSMERIAEALGLEPKTLQRRLAAEGATFSDLLDDVREGMAKRLLIESDMSVERIAGLLDYASNPPFTVAFRRWTGTTPLAYRKAERERRGETV